ncbi:MAG: phosphate regulon sensor histidine kinase PhoR [Burkholderiaceae bacterium]|nr:phosphate regulon sensor histidine kinase PhoR [Burkholderiaceae bacterium]
MAGFWIRIFFSMLGIGGLAWLFAAIGDASSGWTAAVLMLGGWVLYHQFYLHKTMAWLEDFQLDKVPHGSGHWEAMYAKLYKLATSGERRRKQLAETVKDFRSATEAMPDGVVTLDEDNQIIYANEQAEEQLGISNEKDVGRNLINIVRHPEFVSYLHSSVWDEAIVIRGVRGSNRVLQVQLIPYGTRQRMLMTRDITQLDRLETTRRDFVANVSHELKTPLTVLSGFLETMRELPLSDAQRAQYLGLMHAQAHRMQNIVEDLLVLSKLESTAATSQQDQIQMGPLIERLCHDAKGMSREQHQIICECKDDGVLIGAEDELSSAFSNLISNAIRYTPAGGTIRISWIVGADGSGSFSVNDTGPGIESQHIPRLTERFYRVDRSRSRETGGTGLGLAIVKHVTTRHQAQLVIESEVGKGSTFSIVFPEKRRVSRGAEGVGD